MRQVTSDGYGFGDMVTLRFPVSLSFVGVVGTFAVSLSLQRLLFDGVAFHAFDDCTFDSPRKAPLYLRIRLS